MKAYSSNNLHSNEHSEIDNKIMAIAAFLLKEHWEYGVLLFRVDTAFAKGYFMVFWVSNTLFAFI